MFDSLWSQVELLVGMRVLSFLELIINKNVYMYYNDNDHNLPAKIQFLIEAENPNQTFVL